MATQVQFLEVGWVHPHAVMISPGGLHISGFEIHRVLKISFAPSGPEIRNLIDGGVSARVSSKEKNGQHLFSFRTQSAIFISRPGDSSKTKVKPSLCSMTCRAWPKSDFARATCLMRSAILKTVKLQAIGRADASAFSPQSHCEDVIRRRTANRPAAARPLSPASVSASFGVQNNEPATPAPIIHKKIGAAQTAAHVPKANAVPSHQRFFVVFFVIIMFGELRQPRTSSKL